MIPVSRSEIHAGSTGGIFRSKAMRRLGVIALIVAAISIFRIYWVRRAVWAVVNVGGTTSTVEQPRSKRIPEPNQSLPGFIGRIGQWTESQFQAWLPLDRGVFGVNLAHASVDSDWLPRLKTMESLEVLSLNQKQIGARIGELGRLPKLTELIVLHVGKEASLQYLIELPHLERLRLVNIEGSISGFEILGKHPSLQELHLEALDQESRGWATFLNQCEGFSRIHTITIRSQYTLTPGLEALQDCDGLRTLEISAPLTHTEIAVLSRIKQLTSLVINTKNVASDDWLELQTLSNLKTLQIYSGGDAPPPLNELRRLLTNCEIEGGP